MKYSSLVRGIRGIERPRKTIGQIVKGDLELNDLSFDQYMTRHYAIS